MEPIVLLAGILLGHIVIWGIVSQMRRERKRVHRYQLAGFVGLEVALGVWLVHTSSLPMLAWVAANAAMTLIAANMPAPPARR